MALHAHPLEIRRANVRRGALDLEIACDLDALRVTPSQADRILELLPNLAHHVCVNDAGNDTFGAELVGTELPHLLEHVIIELQGKAAGSGASFTGHTSWLEELEQTAPDGYALMRTSVTFKNDFVALTATNDAMRLIAWATNPDMMPLPDVEGMLFHLEAL